MGLCICFGIGIAQDETKSHITAMFLLIQSMKCMTVKHAGRFARFQQKVPCQLQFKTHTKRPSPESSGIRQGRWIFAWETS